MKPKIVRIKGGYNFNKECREAEKRRVSRRLNSLVLFFSFLLVQWVLAIPCVIGLCINMILKPINVANQWAKSKRRVVRHRLGWKTKW